MRVIRIALRDSAPLGDSPCHVIRARDSGVNDRIGLPPGVSLICALGPPSLASVARVMSEVHVVGDKVHWERPNQACHVIDKL